MNNAPASTSPGNLEKEPGPGKGKFYVDIYVIPDRVLGSWRNHCWKWERGRFLTLGKINFFTWTKWINNFDYFHLDLFLPMLLHIYISVSSSRLILEYLHFLKFSFGSLKSQIKVIFNMGGNFGLKYSIQNFEATFKSLIFDCAAGIQFVMK